MAPLVSDARAGTRSPGGTPQSSAIAAVVGLGAVAKHHLSCLAALDGVTVGAVCDLSPAVAESAASRFGVAGFFTDHRTLLAELKPDVVHVTTPAGAHFEVAMDALAAGAHVIVEKPIVEEAEQLETLLDDAERRGLIVVEDLNYVFNPQVREIRRLIATGELGDLQHVEVDLALDILGEGSNFADRNQPHPALAMPGGAIADFLPHLTSLVYVLAGPHRGVSAVWSRRRESALEVDDLRALVQGERATASISFSAASQPDGFWLRAHGTRMRVEANLFEPRLTIQRVRSLPAALFPIVNGAAEVAALARASASGFWGKLSGAPGAYSGLWELVGRTYDAIARGTPPPITPGDIRAVDSLGRELTAEGDRP